MSSSPPCQPLPVASTSPSKSLSEEELAELVTRRDTWRRTNVRKEGVAGGRHHR